MSDAKARALEMLERRWIKIIELIDPAERNMIACALRDAARQYEVDARHNRIAGVPRVAGQLQAQCDHLRAIAEVLDL